MSVDLHTKSESWVGAASGLLISFFDTITYNLENSDRGSKFPLIANELYYGELAPEHVQDALTELKQIEKELADLPPKNVIWDIENLDKQPPWGDDIADTITNLAEYHTTPDGKNLIDVIRTALESAKRQKSSLVIR